MSNFPVNHTLGFGEEKALSTRKSAILGQQAFTPDGRTFRYALNSTAATLAAGVVVQSAVQTQSSIYADALQAALANGVGATIATGITTIALTTVGNSAVDANFFQDGYLYVKVGPGAGAYAIKQHTSASSATGMNIELYAGDKIDRVAHTTATRYALQKNLYSDVVVAPVAATGTPLGIAQTSVPASNFFWLQTGGPAPTQTSGGVVIPSDRYVLSTATAGSIIGATTADPDQLRATIGYGIHINATSALIDMIYLTLD